jgi:hypothetical protein
MRSSELRSHESVHARRKGKTVEQNEASTGLEASYEDEELEDELGDGSKKGSGFTMHWIP